MASQCIVLHCCFYFIMTIIIMPLKRKKNRGAILVEQDSVIISYIVVS